MAAQLHNLHPHSGMTISRGDLEINVHWLMNGEVGYGYYKPGDEMPLRLERRSIDVFIGNAEKAVADGCTVFTKINLIPESASHE